MIGFILFNLFLILLVFIGILIISALWPEDSPWAPWWRTNTRTAEAICKLADVGKGDIIYDLGCGDGEALIIAAKLGAKGTGIEIDPLRYFIAKIRAKRSGVSENLTFKRNSFFNEDISEANLIFVYLIPKTLNKLLPKFRKELKKGTRIVSFRYEMNLKPTKIDRKNNLFLYTI